jgi:hypothetical protein
MHFWGCRLFRVQKVSEYQKILSNASAAKFTPAEDFVNTFGLKLLHFRNYFEIIANLKDHKGTQ